MPASRTPTSSSIVSTRTPEYPFASVFARRSIAARTTSSGYGSPTPQAWLRSRRSWSSAACSGGIDSETNLPKPVLTPYVWSPTWDSRNARAAAARSRPRAPSVDGPTADRDVPDVVDREVVARQLDRGRHGASLDRPPPAALDTARYASASPARRPRQPARAPHGGARLPGVTLSRKLARVCADSVPGSPRGDRPGSRPDGETTRAHRAPTDAAGPPRGSAPPRDALLPSARPPPTRCHSSTRSASEPLEAEAPAPPRRARPASERRERRGGRPHPRRHARLRRSPPGAAPRARPARPARRAHGCPRPRCVETRTCERRRGEVDHVRRDLHPAPGSCSPSACTPGSPPDDSRTASATARATSSVPSSSRLNDERRAARRRAPRPTRRLDPSRAERGRAPLEDAPMQLADAAATEERRPASLADRRRRGTPAASSPSPTPRPRRDRLGARRRPARAEPPERRRTAPTRGWTPS